MRYADGRIEAGVSEKSESGNPAGILKGARNQLIESVLKELISHWEDNGRDAIQLTCKE